MKKITSVAEANNAFKNGDFEAAAKIYKQLLPQGGIFEKIARFNLSLINSKTSKQQRDLAKKHKNLKPIIESLKLSDGNLIITYPIIPWDFRIQRPQHLVSRLSKRGFTSIYIENLAPQTLPSSDDEILDCLETRKLALGVHEICLQAEKGFNIYKTEIFGQNLAEMTKQLQTVCGYLNPKRLIHLVQFPGWAPLAEKVKQACGGSIVYDCMDHHAGFTNNTAEVLSHEDWLIRNADLVLASSLLIEKELKSRAKKVFLIKNGTEYDHFRNPNKNGKLEHLKGPIIGYYGAIADWFDIDIVTQCATKRPNWNFVLIGSTELCNIHKAKQLSNIHFIGEIPYKDLPGYFSYFDVCTIPFKITPLTKATNPVKFYEYLSDGKPVVATKLPELFEYSDFVSFASSANDFLIEIEKSLQSIGDDNLKRCRESFASKNSWDIRVNDLLASDIFKTLKSENSKLNITSTEPKKYIEQISQLKYWIDIKDQEIIALRRSEKNMEAEINRLKLQLSVGDLTWEQFESQVLSKRENFKGIFIQEIIIDWNIPLFQRPQHIAAAFGRLGYLVIYKTANWGNGDHIEAVRKVAENVWMTSLWQVNTIDNAVHSIYSTAQLMPPEDIYNNKKNGIVVYEYIDHIDPAISGNDNIQLLLDIKKWAFSGGADYIVASARKLHEEALEMFDNKQNIIMVPNGVDTIHYRSEKHTSLVLPENYLNFRNKYKYIVGYFGALAPWLWYDMIRELVGFDAEIGYVFIGPDYYNGADKLPQEDNVLNLGAVDYQTLPGYAKLFDVCFIPFEPGEIARTTSPLKLFEYFALEKPVVATSDMIECVAYDEVFRGENAYSIYNAIKKAIAVKDNAVFKDKLRVLADENDWLERAKTMEKCFYKL